MRLLLAEDEKALSSALQVILKHNNYSVDAVYNGQDAYDYIMAGVYDGVILDVMMPKMDGFTVLSKIRAEGCDVPVIMLTAKAETDDKINGLDLGADDSLAKEYQIMELLMANQNAIISAELMMEKIWGYDTDTEISVVWVNISYLRKKLSQIGSGVSIKAVRNQGYTLEYKEADRT